MLPIPIKKNVCYLWSKCVIGRNHPKMVLSFSIWKFPCEKCSSRLLTNYGKVVETTVKVDQKRHESTHDTANELNIHYPSHLKKTGNEKKVRRLSVI